MPRPGKFGEIGGQYVTTLAYAGNLAANTAVMIASGLPPMARIIAAHKVSVSVSGVGGTFTAGFTELTPQSASSNVANSIWLPTSGARYFMTSSGACLSSDLLFMTYEATQKKFKGLRPQYTMPRS